MQAGVGQQPEVGGACRRSQTLATLGEANHAKAHGKHELSDLQGSQYEEGEQGQHQQRLKGKELKSIYFMICILDRQKQYIKWDKKMKHLYTEGNDSMTSINAW